MSKTQIRLAENGSDTFTVKLATEPTAQVTVSVSSGDTAAATVSTGALTFSTTTWNTTQTITVSGVQDDDGANESVTVSLSASGGGYGDETGQATATVTDDAPGLLADPTSLDIGEAGSGTFTVKLTTQPSAQVTVEVASGDTNEAAVSPTSLTFTTGNWGTTQTVTVSGVGDTDTQDENLGVTLTASGGDYAGKTATVGVTVTDDDDVPVKVSFEQTTYTVDEGSSVTVKVKLNADPERTVTIPLTKANQDGASNSDYSGVPANVVFDSGDTEKTFSFSAASDDDDDDGESVKLGFGSTLPAGVSEGSTDEATISITDDDVPSVNVSFEQASYTVAEGGSVTVKVKLNADPERTVVIPLTKGNQGGAADADYSGVPSNVTFNSGDTEKTFSFSATQDSADADGESVKLTFSSTLPAGVSEGSTNETIVSITDDDLPSSLTVQYSATAYSVTEGGDVEVTVTLNTDPERTIEIPLSKSNQGGASDSDYSGVPATLTFNSGDTSKSFTISAAQDNLEDTGESVKLGFGTMLAGVSTGTNTEATVSIANVSAQTSLTVSYGAAAYGLSEGGTATITVNLNAAPGQRDRHSHQQDRTGRSHQRRLLRRPRHPHIRRNRHVKDIHLQRRPGHDGRRRRVGEAGLRDSPRRGIGRDQRRGHSQHHR